MSPVAGVMLAAAHLMPEAAPTPAAIRNFRLARSGLLAPEDHTLQQAARVPAADFSRDAALLALAARSEALTRAAFVEAVDSGELVLAHTLRGAIHVQHGADWSLWGRAMLATKEEDLAAQLGRAVTQQCEEHDIAPSAALRQVADAIGDALGGDEALSRTPLHQAMRERLPERLLPWCKGCKSHHVSPMLWRYATIAAGARLGAERRYRLGKPGKTPAAGEVVRRFLSLYGPAKPGDLATWLGLGTPHARRLWDAVEGELEKVGSNGWLLSGDVAALQEPPTASGLRLLPPGDPLLQPVNRKLLIPDADLRKRAFRPVASPGVVLSGGEIAGLWRVKAKGRQALVSVESLSKLPSRALKAQAERIAELRGAAGLTLEVD